MSRFFINRPIFAWVIAIVIMLAGLVSVFTLPVSQYPGLRLYLACVAVPDHRAACGIDSC